MKPYKFEVCRNIGNDLRTVSMAFEDCSEAEVNALASLLGAGVTAPKPTDEVYDSAQLHQPVTIIYGQSDAKNIDVVIKMLNARHKQSW